MMAIAYFRIEADGVFFQADADSRTGNVSLRVGSDEKGSTAEPVYMSRKTAKMLAKGLAGLAKRGKANG